MALDDEPLDTSDFEMAILRLVKADPFRSIGELRDTYNESRMSDDDRIATWLRVAGVLRRNRLFWRKSRFHFAWRK